MKTITVETIKEMMIQKGVSQKDLPQYLNNITYNQLRIVFNKIKYKQTEKILLETYRALKQMPDVKQKAPYQYLDRRELITMVIDKAREITNLRRL